MLRVARIAAVLALGVLIAPAWADEVDDVMKKVAEAAKKLKSFSCKMETKTSMEMGGGNFTRSEMTGTTEVVRRGEKTYMRTEIKGETLMNFGGQEQKMDSKSLIVSDGEFTWTESEAMGQKNVIKTKAEEAAPEAQIEALRKDHNVKLLPEQKVDGNECYVLEATPKQPSMGGPTRMVMMMCKKTGLTLKTVGYDGDGKEMMTVLMKDVKIDPDLSADRFKYSPPSGVEVMDMTKGGMP
jgi:outer membrane lipoprotein-sorting protein